MDGRRNRRNKAAFSNFSGEVRMGTKSRCSFGYKLALIELVFQFHDSRTKKPIDENYYIQLRKC